jgi:Ca2+-binding EF-hand superfamily protein
MGDMDADGDGMVSKVELAEFLTREGAYEIFDASEVTEVMHRFDKDGNGHLRYDAEKRLVTDTSVKRDVSSATETRAQ